MYNYYRTAPGMGPLFQILGSAVIPGSSQANMYFQLYSSVSLAQAQFMLSDLKLGQYVKRGSVPPRSTFIVQMTGTVVGALLNYVIMQIVVSNERTILLSNEGTRVWSGQQVQSFNANAVLWGALGKEIYGPHGPYFIVPLGIVIGLALPVVPWLVYKKFGWRWLPYLNTAFLAHEISLYRQYLFGAGIDGGAQIFVFIFSFALAGAGGVGFESGRKRSE
ncbi:hypothetical protein Clacol_007320 [Clathrus columnatus]|uniref:Uncharacterized protein n=1 Tax=Clathrus columnatus TaxID=1419009 RepID=A0AAV5AKV3_9AGAM|nr:hypothetical protein Clacol_007320 [Clathrus columnatus]